MLSLALSAAFALPVPAVDDELNSLTNKLAEAKSYAFTVQTESTGSGFGGFGGFGGRGGRGGRGGEEGGERPAAPIVQGTYQAGLPMHVVIGELQAFKEGDQIVHKNAAGEWQVMEDPRSMFSRGGGGFGRGRGGDEGGGEERRTTERTPCGHKTQEA